MKGLILEHKIGTILILEPLKLQVAGITHYLSLQLEVKAAGIMLNQQLLLEAGTTNSHRTREEAEVGVKMIQQSKY